MAEPHNLLQTDRQTDRQTDSINSAFVDKARKKASGSPEVFLRAFFV